MTVTNGRYKIVRKRVSSLKPSPENQQLYRALNDDPDIDGMVKSIKQIGLLDLPVITLDNYIVAGHRRHEALRRIGRVWVKCRQLQKRRDSMTRDEYIALLREHNRQRSKSVAEQVREELVDINPEEAYSDLLSVQDMSVNAAEYNGVVKLEIEGIKRRFNISGQKADHVKCVNQVVFEDRREYWPLSVRGVHYALLNYEFMRNLRRKLAYKNDDESYQATSDLITRLRLNGEIPWEAFDDGTRPLEEFRAFSDVRQFVRQECETCSAATGGTCCRASQTTLKSSARRTRSITWSCVSPRNTRFRRSAAAASAALIRGTILPSGTNPATRSA